MMYIYLYIYDIAIVAQYNYVVVQLHVTCMQCHLNALKIYQVHADIQHNYIELHLQSL